MPSLGGYMGIGLICCFLFIYFLLETNIFILLNGKYKEGQSILPRYTIDDQKVK